MKGKSRLYMEPYDASYLSYAMSYCSAIGGDVVRLSDRHPAWMKLPLWTGNAIHRWLTDNFYSTEPELIIFTNSSNFAAAYASLEDYLKYIPKVMIMISAEVEYPESIRPNCKVKIMQDIANMLIADKVIFHTKAQYDEVIEKVSTYVSSMIIKDIRRKSVTLPTTGLNVSDLKPDLLRRGEKLRILWNHRMGVEKRPEIFLGALNKMKEQGIDFEVVLLTQLPSKRGLKELIDGIQDKIIFQGFVNGRDKYMKWMQSCHVVVSTTIVESFSTSIAEAVACGCIPIVTNGFCFPEMFKYATDDVVWLSNPPNVTELNALLNSLAKNIPKSIVPGLVSNIEEYDSHLTRPLHEEFLRVTIRDFENDIKSSWRDVKTESTDRMVKVIEQTGYSSKKRMMNAIGWGQMERWPSYALRLRELGYELEHVDGEVYYKVKGQKITSGGEWEW